MKFLEKLKEKVFMNMLNNFLATWLAKFKTSSPALFIAVAALLTGLKYALENGAFPTVSTEITQWIFWFIALFTGVHTTQLLEKGK